MKERALPSVDCIKLVNTQQRAEGHLPEDSNNLTLGASMQLQAIFRPKDSTPAGVTLRIRVNQIVIISSPSLLQKAGFKPFLGVHRLYTYVRRPANSGQVWGNGHVLFHTKDTRAVYVESQLIILRTGEDRFVISHMGFFGGLLALSSKK